MSQCCVAQGRTVTLGSHILWVKNVGEKVLGMKSNPSCMGPVSCRDEVHRVALSLPREFLLPQKNLNLLAVSTKFNTSQLLS